MRAVVVTATIVTLCFGPSVLADGLNLMRPTFIDAAAYILYSNLQDYQIDRKSDDLVVVAFTTDMPLELRRLANKKCSLQTINALTDGKAFNQFDFSRFSGEYISTPMGDYFKTRYRLLGDSFYCERWKGEIECRNSYDVYAYGVEGNRNMIRALTFISTQCR